MRKKISAIFQVGRYLGWLWLIRRGFYQVKQSIGYMQWRMPMTTWEAYTPNRMIANEQAGFFENYRQYRDALGLYLPLPRETTYVGEWDHADAQSSVSAVTLADRFLQGEWILFSHQWIFVGYPPKWIDSQTKASDLHWSQYPDFAESDIKMTWEIGRFSFAYALARAYQRTGDERYPEAFWACLTDFCAKNPPNQGIHWKCGQEISLRVIACCFAWQVFHASPATTTPRLQQLLKLMAASASRIERNIHYALQQQNNHGISEALGLWTIGIFFPELKQAQSLRQQGEKWLLKQAQTLIAEDGGFSQQSLNYHRMMLHLYAWYLSVSQYGHWSVSEKLKARLLKAYQFLYQLHDPISGRVPNYGTNDGAYILPLSVCDSLDYRPVLQAYHVYFYGERAFPPGPWDEEGWWLWANAMQVAPYRPETLTHWAAKASGYYTLRTSRSWLFTRCAQFNTRPAHADQLHIDLWWKGINIALDAGTYSYHAKAPWHEGLANTRYHNTVTMNHQDQMDKVGRFIWVPWSKGYVRRFYHEDWFSYWAGWHQGYTRLNDLATHQRVIIRLGQETWLIGDRIATAQKENYQLHYLLHDCPFAWDSAALRMQLMIKENSPYYLQFCSKTPLTVSYVRASEETTRGWQSLYYQQKTPAISLTLAALTQEFMVFSLFSAVPIQMDFENESTQQQQLVLQANNWKSLLHVKDTQLLKTPWEITAVTVEGELDQGPSIKKEVRLTDSAHLVGY